MRNFRLSIVTQIGLEPIVLTEAANGTVLTGLIESLTREYLYGPVRLIIDEIPEIKLYRET